MRVDYLNIKGLSSLKTCSIIYIFSFLLPITRTLDITTINVPSLVDVRDAVTLSCSYNLGSQKLNSVKWYKNDKEFFRYYPLMPTQEQTMIFQVAGVHVGSDYVCNDKFCRIQLDNLSSETSGAYRCEISGEAPAFKLQHRTGNMSVVALPQTNPKIEGLERMYYDHDFVFGNCTSDFSFPPPTMSWYLNEQKADPSFVESTSEASFDAFGFKLYQRSLEIRFSIDKKIYPLLNAENKLQMKCVAQTRLAPTRLMESLHILHVSSDDIRNQTLINWKNSAPQMQSSQQRIILQLLLSLIGFVNYVNTEL